MLTNCLTGQEPRVAQLYCSLVRSIILACLLSCAQLGGYSQLLSESDFRTRVCNKTWSVENKSLKEDYEMMVFAIEGDTLVLAYINWTSHIERMICNYQLNLSQGIFELAVGDCSEGSGKSYIYGYLDVQDVLFLHLDKERLELNADMRNLEGWIEFVTL